MDTNLYALEQIVADRLAHARADAALRARAGQGRRAPVPTASRLAAARRWVGLVLIDLGRALADGGPDAVPTHARPRCG